MSITSSSHLFFSTLQAAFKGVESIESELHGAIVSSDCYDEDHCDLYLQKNYRALTLLSPLEDVFKTPSIRTSYVETHMRRPI